MRNSCAWSRRLLVVSALALFPTAVSRASADTFPIKIAVFNFELDDFSAAAGLRPDDRADTVQLDRATSEVRQLIAQSGRYTLVDVSNVRDEAVKERRLRQCNGCDTAIALKLGADQSFVGVVTRISRTEYTVRFYIRDARTGAEVLARQTDLRMGSDASWNRGATWLVDNGLLNQP